MTETDEIAPLPFNRSIPVAPLGSEGVAVTVTLEADEAAALAAYLGVEAVEGLVFEGMAASDGGEARVDGHLKATVRQSCVVTLEPVVTALDLPVARRYRGDAGPLHDAVDGQVEMRDGDEDAPDPLGSEIDLASLVVEALALAIDPYPRAEGAELGSRVVGPPGVEPLTDEAARPFAKLAELRARSKDGSE